MKSGEHCLIDLAGNVSKMKLMKPHAMQKEKFPFERIDTWMDLIETFHHASLQTSVTMSKEFQNANVSISKLKLRYR